MKRSSTMGILIFVVALAVAVSILLFPFYEQISLMLADEGHYSEALQRYQGELTGGEDTLPVLVSTVKMLDELSRSQEAMNLATSFVANHPDNPQAVAFLLQLYKDSNRENQFLNLFLSHGPKPASESLLRVAQQICESLGDVRAEIPILAELVYQHDGTPKEHFRLAYFLAREGNTEKAADAIQAMINKFPVDALSNLQIDLAVRILIRQNRIDEANKLAARVLKSTKHRSEYFDIVSIFVEEDHPREALAILDMLPEKVRESELGLEVRLSLLDSLGESKAFYELLTRLIATHRLTPRLFADALPIALDEAPTNLLLQMVGAIDLHKINPQNLEEIATRSVDKDEPIVAKQIYNKLGTTYLESFPALLLALALGMGDMTEVDATQRYDSIATRLTDREKAFLAPLFEIRGMDKLSHATLASIKSLKGFTPQEVFALGLKYVGFDMVDQGQVLIDAYASGLAVPPEEVKAATVILKIGKGDVQPVVDWMISEKEISEAILKGFFSIAFEKKYAIIAQMSADRLLKHWPSELYRSYVAAAQAIGDHEEEGLKTLREMFAAGEPVAGLYVDALAYRERNQPNLEPELVYVVTEEAHNPTVSPHLLRRLGYMLINEHLMGLASPLFERLAEHGSLVSDDVQALLYTWGTHPTPVQQEWMVKRAAAAPSKEEIKWLTYFAEADKPQLVLETIHRSPEGNRGDRDILDMHFQALVTLKYKEEATKLLASMLEDETDIKRLKSLGAIAQGGDLTEGAESIFKRILEVNPDDLDTLKTMGILAYGRGDVITAREYLEHYLDLAEGDYLVNFYYGEVLEYYERRCDAWCFYEVALEQVESLQTPTFDENLMRAHLLVRLEYFQSAIDWYFRLIDEHPKQIGLYNDLADLYIDRECYYKAGAIIALGLQEAEDPELPPGERTAVVLLLTQKVRLLKENNCICEALALAAELVEEYPENSEVLEVAADLQVRIGNWGEALDLLDSAIDVASERAILWDERDTVLVDHQPYWIAGVEYRVSGGQRETLARYHFENDILPCYRFYTDLELDYGSITDFALFPSGNIVLLKRARERGAFGVIRQWGCGSTVQGALLLSQGIVGVGVKAIKLDSYGSWVVEGAYHEPCWDLVQSTFQEGARNRIQGTRIWHPLQRTELVGTLGYNQYNLMANDRMATSYLLQAGWGYHLSPNNCWARGIGYGTDLALACALDKEHVLSQVTIIGDDGTPFQPLGLVSREIYTGSLLLTRRFHDWLSVDGSVGMSYDRVAGRGGPEGSFGLTVGRKCGFQGRLLYTHTLSTTGLVTAEDAIRFDLRSPL